MLNHDDFLKQIGDAKVISFDLFDTLVTRPTKFPKYLWKYHGITFYVLRVGAEWIVRRFSNVRGKKEITVEQIYKLLPMYSQARELLLEIEESIPVEYVINWYQEALLHKIPVYIVSDMYWHSRDLQYLLTKHGISQPKEFIVSSDHLKPKKFGLLEKVKENHPELEAKYFLHIGDSFEHDIIPAEEIGMRTIQVGIKNE
jgi:FMN phosphatase YigB (HAD superfamily)